MPTRDRFVRWGITLLLSCGCASAWAQRLPSPDDPKAVVAETQQNAKRQGILRTGRITWKCSDKLCVATSKKVAVGVNTCQALAELVGSLSRFGRVERPIPSYDLALCNVRAQIKLAKLEQQRADAETARARRLSPRTQPVEDVSAPAADTSSSAATAVAGAPPVARPGGGSSRLSGPKPLPRGTLPSPADTAPALASAPSPAAARGAASARRAPPPVVEASPIAPSYRPSIYAIRVTPLAVVGRGSVAAEAEPAPSQPAPSISVGEPEESSSASASSTGTASSPMSASAPEEAWGAVLPGASSSPDATSPATSADGTGGAPGSAQSSLGRDAPVKANAQSIPGSAQSPSGPARTAPAPRPAAASVRPVAVPGLAIVGHGRMQEPVQGTHLTVTVNKLEVIGKREGNE